MPCDGRTGTRHAVIRTGSNTETRIIFPEVSPKLPRGSRILSAPLTSVGEKRKKEKKEIATYLGVHPHKCQRAKPFRLHRHEVQARSRSTINSRARYIDPIPAFRPRHEYLNKHRRASTPAARNRGRSHWTNKIHAGRVKPGSGAMYRQTRSRRRPRRPSPRLFVKHQSIGWCKG